MPPMPSFVGNLDYPTQAGGDSVSLGGDAGSAGDSGSTSSGGDAGSGSGGDGGLI